MGIIIYIIYAAALVYGWLIIARAVLSWFPSRPGTAVYHINGALVTLTEPYLRLFRRFLPVARVGSVGFDLSVIVGLVVLFIVAQFLARI